MNIKFIADTRSILIDDIAGQYTQWMNINFVINAIVAILHFTNEGIDFTKAISYFFILLLVFSVGGLLYINLRRSKQKEIPLDEIENLQSSSFFNRLNYDLILKNGKKRRLYFGDDFESIKQLKVLIEEK